MSVCIAENNICEMQNNWKDAEGLLVNHSAVCVFGGA